MGLLKSFKDKVFLARQFSLSDWLAFTEAWWLLSFYTLALRWISYERLMIPFRPTFEKGSDSSHALIVARLLQQLVGYAARLHPVAMTCLIQSLTLQKMLYKRSIPSRLNIGVNKTMAEIHAHAWVEVEGEAVGESEIVSERFKILNRPSE
jgi:hypothetical protein